MPNSLRMTLGARFTVNGIAARPESPMPQTAEKSAWSNLFVVGLRAEALIARRFMALIDMNTDGIIC